MLRGIGRRCPRCGHRPVFDGWFALREACGGCGLRFAREEGSWLGAYVLNLAVTEVALAAYLVVGVVATLPAPPPLPLALGGAAVATAVPLAFHPSSRTLWCAVDLLAFGREGQARRSGASAATSTADRSSTPDTPRRPAP